MYQLFKYSFFVLYCGDYANKSNFDITTRVLLQKIECSENYKLKGF
jgi:hypothetical protein